MSIMGFPDGSDKKESTWNVGDLGLIPGLGRSSGGGHSNPLQYSGLENPNEWGSLAGYIYCTQPQRVGHDRVTKRTHTLLIFPPLLIWKLCILLAFF